MDKSEKKQQLNEMEHEIRTLGKTKKVSPKADKAIQKLLKMIKVYRSYKFEKK